MTSKTLHILACGAVLSMTPSFAFAHVQAPPLSGPFSKGPQASASDSQASPSLSATASATLSVQDEELKEAIPLFDQVKKPLITKKGIDSDPELENAARFAHAKELLGKYYDKKIAQLDETTENLDQFIRLRIKAAFKGPNQKFSTKVYRAIQEQAAKYGFDPIFLMAVIENESSFNPKVRGTSGEIGLMQVLPSTAKWIAARTHIKWKGDKTLEDPVTNIRIGAAHLAQLREEFKSQGQLYLAAYNMGSGNVQRALAKQVWPKDYPVRVMSRYLKFYSDFKQARALEKQKPNSAPQAASTKPSTTRS